VTSQKSKLNTRNNKGLSVTIYLVISLPPAILVTVNESAARATCTAAGAGPLKPELSRARAALSCMNQDRLAPLKSHCHSLSIVREQPRAPPGQPPLLLCRKPILRNLAPANRCAALCAPPQESLELLTEAPMRLHRQRIESVTH
jgi:hypothetical protein